MSDRNPWEDRADRFDEHPIRSTLRGIGGGMIVVVVVIIVGVIIASALWVGGVFTADVKGRGEAHKERVGATNRIFAQQHFEDLNAAVGKDVANIRASRQAVKVDPSSYNQTNLTGAIQVCNSDVAQYNGDARKYLLKDFRAHDLPQKIGLEVCN